MKKLILTVLLLVTSLCASESYEGSLEFTQEDNSTFFGIQKGDEWFNYIEQNATGNVIVWDGTNYVYAVVDTSGQFPKLGPSTILVGGMPPVNFADTTLSQMHHDAREEALNQAKRETLKGLVGGKTWYEVKMGHGPAGEPMGVLNKIVLDANITSYIKTPLQPDSANPTEQYPFLDGSHISLELEGVFQTFSQGPGYLIVKSYNNLSMVELRDTARWYDNNSNATAHYNTLPKL